MLISVVIPLYNKERNIEETVKSVLNQTYTNFELIIIDDGSTDNSLATIENIRDERIKIIKKKNGGVSSARNRGVKESKSQYIAFLDGDDLWLSNHLEVVIFSIKKTAFMSEEIAAYSTDYVKIKEIDSSHKKENIDVSNLEIEVVNNYFKEAYHRSIISASSVVVKKDIYLLNGGFNESHIIGEDTELWCKLFKDYKLVHIKLDSVFYLISSENRASNRVVPIEKRFSCFKAREGDKHEKKYSEKLMSILILDYVMLKEYKIALRYFLKNKKHFLGIIEYFYFLIKRKYK